MSFLFLIYSCKKNLDKADNLYSLLNNKIPNTKTYIIYGNNKQNEFINSLESSLRSESLLKDDKYLIINSGDYYEDLSEKSVTLFRILAKYFNEYSGYFKIDDDIIPNIAFLSDFINNFIKSNNNNLDYIGYKLKFNDPKLSALHFNKCSSNFYNIYKIIPKCEYCAGPLYYLSNKAINTFLKENIIYFFSEDVSIGYHLEQNGIKATDYHLYSDNKNDLDKICIQSFN